ncbi:uncharacterized protein LOC141617673 [Silene latifolia]|uniref:uncharacterized protein LOC141617673 n=1 Tax=Silene latifolia TaxID=37657 RepID=UPI003D77B8D5
MGSKDWFTFFLNTGLKHYPIQISDHAPIEVDFNLIRNVTKKPYKLDSWALDHEECVTEIQKAWYVNFRGSPAFWVTRKLALVRQRVKAWTLDRRQEWKQKWEVFDDRLEKGMELAIQKGKDEEYSKVDEKVRAFARAADMFWKQRAKIRWAIDGDTCTKYFFNWVKGREGRNFIHGIKGDDGNWVYDPSEVSRAFQQYFMGLYGANSLLGDTECLEVEDEIFRGVTKSLTNDDVDWLRKSFTAKEVRTAGFQMGPLKSQGPDGIPAIFFQKC